MNLHNWNQCPIPIFEKFREKYSDYKYTKYKVYSVTETGNHTDAFASKNGMIFYDAYSCENHNLTEEECFACIAHELGHLLDSTPSINNMPSEERELNADKKVIELGLQEYLISALNKMCPNDELTKKRINALKGICMYNIIYIIESFDNNPKSILLKYGEDLKKAICRYLATKKNYNLKCNYIFLHNKNEWESLWHTLESACEQGEIPIIHFISHGESDGLKISSDTIPWKDVGEQFSKINKLSHNLFVTMHVCYSACLLEHISEYTFIGCICAYEKVYRSSNVLKPRFISFYESIFNNQSLCKAIDAFKNEILQEEVNMNKNHWIVCLKNIFEDNYEKLPLEYWKVNTK